MRTQQHWLCVHMLAPFFNDGPTKSLRFFDCQWFYSQWRWERKLFSHRRTPLVYKKSQVNFQSQKTFRLNLKPSILRKVENKHILLPLCILRFRDTSKIYTMYRWCTFSLFGNIIRTYILVWNVRSTSAHNQPEIIK